MEGRFEPIFLVKKQIYRKVNLPLSFSDAASLKKPSVSVQQQLNLGQAVCF